MIRKAKKSDFEFIYPILKQIFDEMDMASIKKLPESQFYDLMRLGFISEYYRYSYRRTWVYADTKDRPIGMVAMYSYEDQKVIDFVLKKEYAKVDLATDMVIFDDKEAWPNEWYVDSLAVTPKYWGEHVASSLLDYAFKIAEQKRFNKVSLNVDKENPRAQKLYVHKGFKTVDKMTIGDRNYDHMIKKV